MNRKDLIILKGYITYLILQGMEAGLNYKEAKRIVFQHLYNKSPGIIYHPKTSNKEGGNTHERL